jgi:DNA replication protein DnaC
MMKKQLDPCQSLPVSLRALRLPAFVAYHDDVTKQAEKEGWSFPQYLSHLAELELHERQTRRVQRLLRASNLPLEKTMATFKQSRLPAKIRRQMPTLCNGDFVRRAENLLTFGLPGRGKSHLVAAIGHELVQQGISVLYVSAYALVQQLLIAKKELLLERKLKKLDRIEAVIIDDIGYIQQDRQEMEVLFTFLAERYERRSVIITSNLVFSKWDRIFKDPMTTMAAIDRLVHHSTILELTGPSYRGEEAKEKNNPKKPRKGKKDEDLGQ